MGEVDQFRGAFYSLDELSTIAFFSLACVLALFWAEVYYIAIDQVTEYRYLIRPMTYAINVGAYVAVIGCAYAAVHATSDTSDYIYWNFSLLVSILFVLAAIVFTFFAYKAAMEISSIPVHMSTRQERTDELSRIFTIFILALIARAACLLLMSNDNLSTDTALGVILVAAYFILLELVPVIFAIVFYRTVYDSSSSRVGLYDGVKMYYDDISATEEESLPLSSEQQQESERDIDQHYHKQDSSYQQFGHRSAFQHSSRTAAASSSPSATSNNNASSTAYTHASNHNNKYQDDLAISALLKRLSTSTATGRGSTSSSSANTAGSVDQAA